MELRRIDPMSTGRFLAAFYAILGVIVGGVFSLMAMLGMTGGEGGIMIVVGLGALLLFPLIYGFLGFVAGALAAILYNAVAGMVGGIELEFGPSRRGKGPVEEA